MKTGAALFLSIVFLKGISLSAFSQSYSSDNSDLKSHFEIRPIGDFGNIEAVLDLRGFVPISGTSKAKYKEHYSGSFSEQIFTKWQFSDLHSWYKLPTKHGVGLVYYGSDDFKLSNTQFLRESQLAGENKQWAALAYDLTETSGKKLFEATGHSFGFDGAEPINILITAQSVFVVVNFRYTDPVRWGTGQVLTAFEFSRALKGYKTYYEVYTTALLPSSARKAFEKSLPIVTKALTNHLFGQ